MDSVTGSKGVIARRFGTLSVVSSLDFGGLATVGVGGAGIKGLMAVHWDLEVTLCHAIHPCPF